MSFYGLMRDLERAANAAERNRIRQQKQALRISAMNQRAYEKQQKQQHLERMQIEADKRTDEILCQYKMYDNFCQNVLNSDKFFTIDNFKKKYVSEEFQFDEPIPVKSSKSECIKIPKESKIAFFQKRRLAKIEKKENLAKQEEQLYEDELKKYKNNKKRALELFEKNENKKMKEIEEFNLSIENWKKGCISNDKQCIDKYIAHFFQFLVNSTGDKLINKIQYDLRDKQLIIEVYMKKEEEIFPCEGYRFYKQRDVIEPIATKKVTINTMLKEIIPNIAISFLDIVYKNDELELVDNLIINVYYTRKCCASLKLSKEDYKNFDLRNEDMYYYVFDHFMKNYKVITTGVKPYDSIYLELV